MTRSGGELLGDALAHFERIEGYAEGDLNEQVVIDAICMRLSAGIEVLGRLAPDSLEGLFGDSWTDMWGMRNRIAHGYLSVNTDIVRQTVEEDLPPIIAAIRAELS